MIILSNKDRIIFDIQNKILDIIKEYQDTGEVTITTNNEGICLTSSGLYDILNSICSQWGFDKKKIKIITPNAEESHPDFNIEIVGNHWVGFSKVAYNILLDEKTPKYTVGCFLGKPNWHRLITSAWLFNNHHDKTLQTMHYDRYSERHRIDCELTEININAPSELLSVVNFIPNCPLVLDEGYINYTIGPDKHYNIMHQYKNIFIDLVSETYISGMTFFPTEKTFRPIIAKTPFITIGPSGHLANLQRIGFKTFDKWWDEGYDMKSDYDRILAIREIMNTIYQLTPSEMRDILIEMSPVLEHNYNILKTLNNNDTKLNGN